MSRENNYKEGDWFAVPLRETGYGIGNVARASRGGVLLGFFFGPRRDALPDSSTLSVLTPQEAALVRHFGHLGLREGIWPNLGSDRSWDRSRWSATEFGRRDPLRGYCFKETYDDNDPNRHVRSERISESDFDLLPSDGISGAGAIEIRLTRLLT